MTAQKFIVCTLHHLSCTGGTLISKCLASMPKTVLISEINPLHTGPVRFNPFDPLQQFQAQYQYLSESELKQAFLSRLEIVVQKCIEHDRNLILRDHSHSDFLYEQLRSCNALYEFTSSQYPVKSVITLRNPIDAYLSMQERNWHKGVENFDNYCHRFLAFTERYKFAKCFLYENFILEPESILREICAYYGIDFDPSYKNQFFKVQLTGDSGRSSKDISPRHRRKYSREFKREILKSEHFEKISQIYGYRLD